MVFDEMPVSFLFYIKSTHTPSSFHTHTHTHTVYSESTQSPGPQKWTPSVPPLDEGKRFSIMTPSFSEDNSDSDNKRSSMEDSSDVSLIHHSASQYNDTTDCKGNFLIRGRGYTLSCVGTQLGFPQVFVTSTRFRIVMALSTC